MSKHVQKKKMPSISQSFVQAKEMLTRHGLKVTQSRLAVFQAIEAAGTPISAQEIGAAITAGVADPVTIYRILQSFTEKGVVRKVNLRHDHVDYELIDDSDHHHLVCMTCGLVEDFEGCQSEKLARTVLKQSKHFSAVREHAIELFGECKTCASR